MNTQTCDVVVVGSGAAGYSTAIVAVKSGLDVIMVEKEPVFGGTTALSAGIVWIPGSRQAQDAGVGDTKADALQYLLEEAGDQLNLRKAETFIENAPRALAYFETNTDVRFELSPNWSDYHQVYTGACAGGRSLSPIPFDGRLLNKNFDRLKPPLSTMMIFGGMMIGRDDIPHLFNFTRSAKSFIRVAGLFLRYLKDRLNYQRGTQLSNGNALVARLAKTAFDLDIPLLLSSPVIELKKHNNRIVGIIVQQENGNLEINARRGVVLATGGFPASKELTKDLFPHVRKGRNHVSVAPKSNTGDSIRLAREVGAGFIDDLQHPAAWVPVSMVPRSDGVDQPFPHFIDRGKPGYIAVSQSGSRFVSEAVSYHDFTLAMIDASPENRDAESFLICDQTAIRRFGMGVAPPWPGRIGPHLRNGYIKSASTLSKLAVKLGVDPAGLEVTVENYNRNAASSVDPDFSKGNDAYEQFNGTPHGRGTNPCIAPIEHSPFFGVRLVPGDIATFAGLSTDERGRVTSSCGNEIAGLYAVGNDMASIMGGTYPGAGITIGPAITFGYIAALDLASSSKLPKRSTLQSDSIQEQL